MGRKKVENGLTKDMIVEEADRQFLQIDFQKVSMRSIASALGFSHGSIYYHFQNKTDLFNAVIEKYFTILNNLLDSALKFDCLEGTKYVLTNYIQFGLDNQSQYDFMFVKYDGLNDPLQQIAPKESLKKFIHTLQCLHKHTLDENNIHSTFIALHGFVLYYKGRVENFEQAQEEAQSYTDFLLKTLVR